MGNGSWRERVMRTLMAILFSVVMITVVGVGFIVMRPVYVELMDALKTIVYDMDISTLTQGSWI